MSVAILPSAEIVMGSWLRSRPAITALCDQRVGTRLADTLPAIRLQRTGTAAREDYRDDAEIQIDCWAAEQYDADLLVRTLLATLPDIRNVPVQGGRVHSYEITAGPYWAPDDPSLTGNARYIVSVALLITT